MKIMIKKRSGQLEPLSIDKTKKMIAYACKGFEDCNPLELEMDAKIQFRDGMTTKEIQKLLIQSAIEKVIQTSEDQYGNTVKSTNINWQYVAARLYLADLYKEAAIQRKYTNYGYGNFADMVEGLVAQKKYGTYLLSEYTMSEVEELGNYINPDRDLLFNYEGISFFS